MLKIFEYQYYAEVLSTIAILLSVGQIVVSAIKKKTNIELFIEDVQQYSLPETKAIIVLFSFINKSDAPINITHISLLDKSKDEVYCGLRKSYIAEHYYPKYPETDIPRTERVFTLSFPISLISHGAQSGHVKFEVPLNLPNYKEGDDMTFIIYTDKKCVYFLKKCKIHNLEALKYL